MKSEKVKDIEFITPLCMLVGKMFTNAKAALTRKQLESFEGFVLVLPQIPSGYNYELLNILSDEI